MLPVFHQLAEPTANSKPSHRKSMIRQHANEWVLNDWSCNLHGLHKQMTNDVWLMYLKENSLVFVKNASRNDKWPIGNVVSEQAAMTMSCKLPQLRMDNWIEWMTLNCESFVHQQDWHSFLSCINDKWQWNIYTLKLRMAMISE